MKTYTPREPRRCPHCRSTAARSACVKCMREMCEDCISFHSVGKVCGLCRDRMDADGREKDEGEE